MSESRRAPVKAPNANAAGDVNAEPRPKIDRRALLRAGALAAGAGLAGFGASAAALRAAQDAPSQPGAESIGEAAPPWMKTPGRSFSAYGMPSHWQEKVRRTFLPTLPFASAPALHARRLSLLEGTITPNGLHFERHHNGIPDIDPAPPRTCHSRTGEAPLAFSVETLLRYPHGVANSLYRMRGQ